MRVDRLLNRLRWHIKRRANTHAINDRLPPFLRKSKISNFHFAVLNQDISWLEIPMKNRLQDQILIGLYNLFQNIKRLHLGNFLLLVDKRGQIPLFTVFQYNMNVPGILKNVIAFDDMGVVEFGVDFELVFYEV
jgi:hypothetical protein